MPSIFGCVCGGVGRNHLAHAFTRGGVLTRGGVIGRGGVLTRGGVIGRGGVRGHARGS